MSQLGFIAKKYPKDNCKKIKIIKLVHDIIINCFLLNLFNIKHIKINIELKTKNKKKIVVFESFLSKGLKRAKCNVIPIVKMKTILNIINKEFLIFFKFIIIYHCPPSFKNYCDFNIIT